MIFKKAVSLIFMCFILLGSINFSFAQISENDWGNTEVTSTDVGSGYWSNTNYNCGSCNNGGGVYDTPTSNEWGGGYYEAPNNINSNTSWNYTEDNTNTYFTTGYDNYTNNYNSNYVSAYWGVPATPAPVSAPIRYNPAPTYNSNLGSNPGASYTATNWNSYVRNTPAINSAPVRYNPAPVYTQPKNTGSVTYTPTNWNSYVVNTNTTNNTGQRYVSTQTYQCQQYYASINGQCVQTQKACLDGSIISIASTCFKMCDGVNGKVPETQTCPSQTLTQTCWDGSTISINQSCPAQMKTCLDGRVIKLSSVCNKVCKNGVSVSELSQCPTQTQKCLSGLVIGMSETCNKTCPNGSVVAETRSCEASVYVAINKTTTLAASEVKTTSARCNGLSTNNTNSDSVGYFEYGTTADLGNKTNQANIGSQNTTTFSNVITGLASNTTYYCRAVTINNAGTKKGEIISFKTKSNETKYVSSLFTNKTEIKKTVVCKDVIGNTADIKEGEKLVQIEVTNVGDVVVNSKITYKVSYKNNSDINLTKAYIKVGIPAEYEYIGKSGKVDGSDITLDIGTIMAGEQKEKTFEFEVKDNIIAGTSVVTSAYVYYEMLDEEGKTISDDNSTYSVTTVVEKETKSTEAISQTGSVWYVSLFKWLAIILLFAVLVLLGKNIHTGVLHRRHKERELSAHH